MAKVHILCFKIYRLEAFYQILRKALEGLTQCSHAWRPRLLKKLIGRFEFILSVSALHTGM